MTAEAKLCDPRIWELVVPLDACPEPVVMISWEDELWALRPEDAVRSAGMLMRIRRMSGKVFCSQVWLPAGPLC